MSNLYLSVANYALPADCQVSASTSQTGFEPAKILEHSLATFYRSQTRTCSVDLNFSKLRTLGIVGAIKTNFTGQAYWRIRVYLDTAKTNLTHDSGLIPCFFQYSGIGVLPWGQFVWGAGFGSFDGFEPRVKNCFYVLPEFLLGRTVTIDFEDFDLLAANFLEIAKVWAGSTYVPPEGALYGSSLISNDRASMREMESGVREYSRPKIVRGMSLDLDLRKDALTKGLFSSLYFAKGKTADMVAYLEPDSPEYQQFQAIYGNLTELKEISQVSWRRLSTNLTLMERV